MNRTVFPKYSFRIILYNILLFNRIEGRGEERESQSN